MWGDLAFYRGGGGLDNPLQTMKEPFTLTSIAPALFDWSKKPVQFFQY